MSVQFNWIYGAFHWVEEDLWRYCYIFSRPNEPVEFTMEWLAKQCETASWSALAVAVVVAKLSILERDKGKRKIVDFMEEEQSCKFRSNPLVEKAAMAIEAKR